MEVGRILPAFLVDLRVIVHEAVDGGHAIELRAESIKEETNVDVEGGECALADLEGVRTLDDGCTWAELRIKIDVIMPL